MGKEFSRRLIQEMDPFHRMRPWPGLFRTTVNVFLLGYLTYLAFSSSTSSHFVFWCLVTGVWYGSVFVTTHDALHHTLTGWRLFDEIIGRLVAYPGLWFHGVYSELHKRHHKMNGNDLKDPERVAWTKGEYENAGPLLRWYVRNQWFADLFLLGGFGMIGKHLFHGLKMAPTSRAFRIQLAGDLAGIFLVNGIIYYFAFHYGAALRYLVYFLILERTIGVVHQLRAHIEHYGLWRPQASPLDTQVFSSRNIRTNPIISHYFYGLNYHSIHHAFPRIPFYNLKAAQKTLAAAYRSKGNQLKVDRSYFRTALGLALKPQLIEV